MVKYFDVHSHFNLPEFEKDAQVAILKMKEEETATICIGTDVETSKRAIELSDSEYVFAGVGIHPNDDDQRFDEIEKLSIDEKVVCIGECGLDYFRTDKEEGKERQIESFKKQIEIAKRVRKPLMLHIRPSKDSMDAYEDALEVLKGHDVVVDVHFFVGNLDIAKKFVERRAFISFPGVITFANQYDEVVKYVPLEQILSETDSPYATPVPWRGKRNEPWMVKSVVEKIAVLKGLDVEEVREQLLVNAYRYMGK